MRSIVMGQQALDKDSPGRFLESGADRVVAGPTKTASRSIRSISSHRRTAAGFAAGVFQGRATTGDTAALGRPHDRGFRQRLRAGSSPRDSDPRVHLLTLFDKPQRRRKLFRSSSASASATSERSCQGPNGNAQKSASGGQAGSPLVAAWLPPREPLYRRTVQDARDLVQPPVPAASPWTTLNASRPIRQRAIRISRVTCGK